MRTRLGNSLKRLAVGGVIAAAATTAHAATDGTTGFTSTGDLLITLTVNNEVKISNLADIDLGVFGGTDVSGTSPACVYRNGLPGGAYNITATGSGAGNAFELTDGTDIVDYAVEFDDGSGFSGLTTGVALGSSGATNADDDCFTAGADNAAVRVTVTAADAAVLPASVYTGTLTLLVAPL